MQDKSKLIFLTNENENVLYYVHKSESHCALKNSRSSIGNGGRDCTIKELSNKYKNISCYVNEIFLNLCEPCRQKQKGNKKEIVVKPTVFT